MNNEFYDIKYYFRDKYYSKSFYFVESTQIIDKKNIRVTDPSEINEMNSFMREHLYNILDNKYILENISSIKMDQLIDDLIDILKNI